MVAEDLVALDAASPKRIVVAGDALVDVWVHGTLQPSQDGCDKFVETNRVVTPGGAANAAQCLTHWKCTTVLVAQTDTQRGIKTRYLDDQRLVFRHDDETREASCTWHRERALDCISYAADAVLLCDYDKGFLTPDFLREAIDLANKRGIPCVVDAKRDPSFYRGTYLKCNKLYAETYLLAGRPGTVITCGADHPLIPSTSMPYFPDGETMGCWMVSCNTAPVPCVNHVGAGDCFAAHLTLALAHGLGLTDAARLAHSAGRVYVQHPHNRAPHPEEISRDLD